MKTNKTDKWFSQYIRLKYADENGIVRCYTCDTPHHWKELDCGHYVKRQHQETRFNENNCRPQCRKCNWFMQGNDVEFRKRLIEEIGEQKVLLLESARRNTKKYTKFELDLLAKEYQKKISKYL